MSTQLEDLVRDLTQAKRKIRDAQEAVDDAKINLAQRRKALNDAVRAKEELEDEITDPAKRPMAALWNRPGAGEGSADERQRGPTRAVDGKPKRGRKSERSDRKERPADPTSPGSFGRVAELKCSSPDDPKCQCEACLTAMERDKQFVRPPEHAWTAEKLKAAIEAAEGTGALERAAAHQNLPLVVCKSCRSLYHVRHHACPRCDGDRATPIRCVLYDLGVWQHDGDIVIDPMAAAKPAAEEPAEGDAEAVEMCALHPPVEWTSEDLNRELELAITAPLGEPTQAWDTFRELGFITDVQIAEVLRSIWPRGHGFQAGRPKGKGRFAKVSPGCTIHGFPMPQFWIGARRHDTMRRPTLAERPLIDRVRQVLGLPRATPAMLDAARAQVHAEHEPVKPGRKGPRKPAVAP